MRCFGCGKGEVMEKAERIQLPPIERGTDSNLVKMLWEYVQLGPEDRESLGVNLAWKDPIEAHGSGEDQSVKVVASEELKSFHEAMKDVIADIILETSQFACWLHHEIYDRGAAVEDLLKSHPETGDLILVMSNVFNELKKEEQ